MATFVFLDLRPPGMDGLSDLPLCAAAGFVEEAGATVRQLRAVQGTDSEAALSAFVTAAVSSSDTSYVVVERLWPRALLRPLLRQSEARLLWLRQDVLADPESPVDLAVGLDPDALGALARGVPGEKVPGLSWRDASGVWRHNESAAPEDIRRSRRLHWSPRFQIEVLPGAPPADLSVQALVGNDSGCAYRADVRRNPLFSSLSLDPHEVQTRGCSFCLDQHGGHVSEPAEETVAFLLDQLQHLDGALPHVERLVLADDRPLPLLARFLAQAPPRSSPTALWLKLRADDLLAGQETLREAGRLAEKRGWSLNPYCVGIESFSEHLLQLFNKGVRAEQTERAVALLRSLDGAPGLRLASGRAHGFLLWTPWTTLDDVLVNVRTARRCRFEELRDDWTQTRLRLDPRLPLYALATRDDLLAGGTRGASRDRANEQGYDPATDWCFADHRAALVDRLFHGPPFAEKQDGDTLETLSMAVRNLHDDSVEKALSDPSEETALRNALSTLADRGAWEPWHDRAALAVGLPRSARALDTNLETVRAGVRSAAIRESVEPDTSEALRFLLSREGLYVAVVPEAGHAGRLDVLVARDVERLRELSRAHETLRSGENTDDSVRTIGSLLDYPKCCVEAFLERGDRRNDVDNVASTLGRSSGPTNPRLNIFALRQLIGFHPCRFDCPEADERAQRALTGIRQCWGDDTAKALERSAELPMLLTTRRERFLFLETRWKKNTLHYGGVAGPPSENLRRLRNSESLPEGEPGLLLAWGRSPNGSWLRREDASTTPLVLPDTPQGFAEERLVAMASEEGVRILRLRRDNDVSVIVFDVEGTPLRLELSPASRTKRAYRMLGKIALSYRVGAEAGVSLSLQESPARIREFLERAVRALS